MAGRERRRNFGINTYLGADEEVMTLGRDWCIVAER